MSTPAEIARRAIEIANSSASADAAMAVLEPHMDSKIEWVNPVGAIEGATPRGDRFEHGS